MHYSFPPVQQQGGQQGIKLRPKLCLDAVLEGAKQKAQLSGKRELVGMYL